MKYFKIYLILICTLCFLAISVYAIPRACCVMHEEQRNKKVLEIREGILCTHKRTIKHREDGKIIAEVKLSEPVVVAMADKEYPWGYYQFPSIGKAADGTLIVRWSMKEDSHKAYGAKPRGKNSMMSKDGGNTWSDLDKNYFAPSSRHRLEKRNGDVLQTYSYPAKDITKYSKFPKAIDSIKNTKFYDMSCLPDELQGVYFNYWSKATRESKNVHGRLIDSCLIRYAIDGLMPVVWWGDIKEMADGTLIAGTYPSYYADERGKVLPSGVSFYKSTDNGRNWIIQGKIPFQTFNKDTDRKEKRKANGFEEPAFEVLKDSTFMCVMRTGGASPMYMSLSKDKGCTWSIPIPFTPNGVMPLLMTLDNGVVVLVSGRPGIQVRFNFDGKGEKWTDPIDMLPFMEDYKKTKDNGAATCGYASLLKADDNSFYMVYSDFKAKNELEDVRKAILFRKIQVKKK